MKYEGYMLVVKDVGRSKRFYRRVLDAAITLDLDGHVVFEGGFFLLREADWLAYAEQREDAVRYGHRSGELVFEVDDIDAFMVRLAGFPDIPLLHGLKEHPWGRRAVRFSDPDGHVIEVGESMRVVVKRFLKNGMSVEEAARRSEFPVSFARMCQAELEAE